MSHFKKLRVKDCELIIVSSDDSSATRELDSMAGLAQDVLGREFGVIDPETREFYAGLFSTKEGAVKSQRPCVAMGRISLSEYQAAIDTVAVRRDDRGQQLGSNVLRALESVARDRAIPRVEVKLPRAEAVSFFENNGYTELYRNFDGSIQTMSKSIDISATALPTPALSQ
ncbi:MAG TPA: GNAT family N-acetyltransferase [Candidatus Saccharimonadales bacterium]|nr:GNAT family N-acetyltransferase [Candidatus Saccharimonadales bacterium]